jgi:esterase/lipase
MAKILWRLVFTPPRCLVTYIHVKVGSSREVFVLRERGRRRSIREFTVHHPMFSGHGDIVFRKYIVLV